MQYHIDSFDNNISADISNPAAIQFRFRGMYETIPVNILIVFFLQLAIVCLLLALF